MKRFAAALKYLSITAIIIFLDRLTKQLALANCVEPCIINRFVSFECIFNRGISWGLLSSDHRHAPLLMILLTAAVILIMIFYTYRCWQRNMVIIGETLVLAGAISNLFDRFMYRGVIDFIHISCCGYSWPNFNVADMFIVLGVSIMIIEYTKE